MFFCVLITDNLFYLICFNVYFLTFFNIVIFFCKIYSYITTLENQKKKDRWHCIMHKSTIVNQTQSNFKQNKKQTKNAKNRRNKILGTVENIKTTKRINFRNTYHQQEFNTFYSMTQIDSKFKIFFVSHL